MNAIATQTPLINVFNTVIDGINQMAVNARDLHNFLKVGRDFSNWIKGRIAQYVFIENQDFIVFAQTGENLKGGRPTVEYHLTLDMAKELSMVENNEEGRKVRRYFIRCEKELFKSDSKQRDVLIRACEELSVGRMARPQAYALVANQFGYDKPIDIPVPLIAEATAFAYQMILRLKPTQPTDTEYTKKMFDLGKAKADESREILDIIDKALTDLDYSVAKLKKNNATHFSIFESLKIEALSTR